MMKFTEVEQLLLDCLKLSKVDKAIRIVIFLILKKETQKIEMCEYLLKHETASEAEILEKAREIGAE